jgi:ABC-type phosphate transport system substrate-binding protein
LLSGRVLAVVLLVSVTISVASAKDIAVISNKSSSLSSITLADLIKVSKAEMNHWQDGKVVTFVMREPASADMKIVLEKIYGMSADAVNSLVTNVNHGHVNRPAIVVVNSDDAVLKKVESTPGAVGVVDVYSITSAVSVVKVGGKLPLEPGYALHGN